MDGSASGGSNDASTSGDAAAPSGKIGIIALTQTVETLPAPAGTIVAAGAVAQFGFRTGSSSCTSVTSGDCQLFTCTPGSSTPGTDLVQAGSITVTGLATSVSLSYMAAQSGYMSSAYGSYLWTASTPATVVVTGSVDVPAFTMSVVAPNPIVVTSPLAQGGSTYAISRATPLAVTWTGGVEGSVTVSLASNTGPNGQVSISCSVDAGMGKVTVPESFMAELGTSGSFSAGVTNVATKNVDDWLMDFQASTTGAQGTATFSN